MTPFLISLLKDPFRLHNMQWAAFFLALCFSLVITPLITRSANKLNLVSQGGGRHIHQTPVPRLGGVGIYISCLLTSLLFIVIHGRYTPKGFEHFELFGVLVSATLIFLVGLLDDTLSLPAYLKLLAQIFASVIAWLCNVQIKYIVNPLFFFKLSESRVFELNDILGFIFTIGWLVLITNALNLIDGMDGLAGGVSLITALSLWAIFVDPKIMQPAGALLAATVSGALFGFLRSNYNPARIFMGDGGAYFVGFTLGAAAVAGLSGNPNTATVGSVVVIAFLFPLTDTLFAITRRLLNRKPIMQPDADHIHHRILRTGLSTKATMFLIYGTCALLGLIVCLLTGSLKRYLILILMTASLGALNMLWKRGKPETKDERNNTN